MVLIVPAECFWILDTNILLFYWQCRTVPGEPWF